MRGRSGRRRKGMCTLSFSLIVYVSPFPIVSIPRLLSSSLYLFNTVLGRVSNARWFVPCSGYDFPSHRKLLAAIPVTDLQEIENKASTKTEIGEEHSKQPRWAYGLCWMQTCHLAIVIDLLSHLFVSCTLSHSIFLTLSNPLEPHISTLKLYDVWLNVNGGWQIGRKKNKMAGNNAF